jgi:predicted nucleic acid-binding protein
MASKKKALKRPLLFVDTNVLLDFYRSKNDLNLQLLSKLEGVIDRIVTTYIVEMEFKKHRQEVMLESLKALKVAGSISSPSFLADHKTLKAAQQKLKDADGKMGKLRDSVAKALLKPTTHDRVYQGVQRIASTNNTSDLNLTRANDDRRAIRRQAWRRFMMGFPPRKSGDTSIGDAFNWEWLMACASPGKRDIVILSRDQDYGRDFGQQQYVNDYLLHEFKDRVSQHGRIVLTKHVSVALEHLDAQVDPKEAAAETEFLEQRRRNDQDSTSTPTDASADKEVDIDELLK